MAQMMVKTIPSKSELSKDEKRILTFIAKWNLTGATCDECEVALNMIHQTVSSRLTSLRRWGFVAYSGSFRLTRRGRQANVYMATEV